MILCSYPYSSTPHKTYTSLPFVDLSNCCMISKLNSISNFLKPIILIYLTYQMSFWQLETVQYCLSALVSVWTFTNCIHVTLKVNEDSLPVVHAPLVVIFFASSPFHSPFYPSLSYEPALLQSSMTFSWPRGTGKCQHWYIWIRWHVLYHRSHKDLHSVLTKPVCLTDVTWGILNS